MTSLAVALTSIPIDRIRPNVTNSLLINRARVEGLKASIRARGLRNPIKVRPLTPEERIIGPDYDYELLGGRVRLLAVQELGWTSISALILPLSPGEGVLEAFTDNLSDDIDRLDWLS